MDSCTLFHLVKMGFKTVAPDAVLRPPLGHNRRTRFEVPPLFQTEQLQLDLFYILDHQMRLQLRKSALKFWKATRIDTELMKSDFKPKRVLASNHNLIATVYWRPSVCQMLEQGLFTRYLIYLYDSPVRCILYGSVVKTGNYGSGCLGSNPSLHHLLCTLGSFTSCASVSSSIKMRLPHGLLESTKYQWLDAWYIVRAQLTVSCYKFLEIYIHFTFSNSA